MGHRSDSPPVSAENRGRGGQGEHDEIKPGSAARVMSISGSPTFDPAVPARDRLRWLVTVCGGIDRRGAR